MKTWRWAALAALVGAFVSAPSGAHAYVVKRASSGALVRWNDEALSFVMHSKARSLSEGDELLDDALASWSRASGAPELALRSQRAPDAPGMDGVNGVFVGDARGALAVTIVTFDEDTGAILDADVVVDEDRSFYVDSEGDEGTSGKGGGGEPRHDLRKVVAHEIGHALGLGDEPGHEDALMFPVVRSKEGRTRPGSDDLAGIALLYGAEAQAASTSESTMSGALADAPNDSRADARSAIGCTFSRVCPTTSSAAAWPLTTLGLVSLVRLRRRLSRRT